MIHKQQQQQNIKRGHFSCQTFARMIDKRRIHTYINISGKFFLPHFSFRLHVNLLLELAKPSGSVI